MLVHWLFAFNQLLAQNAQPITGSTGARLYHLPAGSVTAVGNKNGRQRRVGAVVVRRRTCVQFFVAGEAQQTRTLDETTTFAVIYIRYQQASVPKPRLPLTRPLLPTLIGGKGLFS